MAITDGNNDKNKNKIKLYQIIILIGEKAYTASQAFFTDHPKEEVTLQLLQKYGLKIDSRVDLTVIDGYKDSLKLRSKYIKGNMILMIDCRGEKYRSIEP